MLHITGCSFDASSTDNKDVMSETTDQKLSYIAEKGGSGDITVAGDIVRFLEVSDVQVRASACFYLGYLEARVYIDLVLNHLGSKGEEVQTSAYRV